MAELLVLPALVLSTGTAALGVIRSLGQRGVPVIGLYPDESEAGRSSRYLVESIRSPHPDREEGALLALLEGLAERYPGAVVMPCSDGYVGLVARNRAALERHFRVASPSPETARRVLEKHLTYEVAEKAGVAVPRTVVLTSDGQVEREGRRVAYPCLAKPVTGHEYSRRFHKKMVLAADFEALRAAWREADAAGFPMMLQEFVPGPDGSGVNYNAYAWQGEPRVEFTAAKIRGAPPRIGSPCVVESRRVPEVVEPGRRLLRALDYSGFACVEFKRDARDGIYRLMEVNGRHNMSARLATRCGIDFPWLEYLHHATGELPRAASFESGVYWIDPARDLATTLGHWRERPSLREWLAPYRAPHVFAALAADDPGPGWTRLRQGVAGLGGRVRRLGSKTH